MPDARATAARFDELAGEVGWVIGLYHEELHDAISHGRDFDKVLGVRVDLAYWHGVQIELERHRDAFEAQAHR